MKFSTITLLGAATIATAQHHHHHRHNHARHGSPVEERAAAVVETVAGPVVTVYELNGKKITADDVNKGLKDGKYVLIGEKITSVKPSSTTTTKAAPTPPEQGAKLFEKPKSKSTTTTTTTIPPPPPPTTTTEAPPPPPPSTTAEPEPTQAPEPSGGNGIDSDFSLVSGKISCSEFPSSYGPIAVDWLNHGGWTGLQRVPGFNLGADSAVSYIAGGIDGDNCSPGSFCSYACPAGYQKSQWPEAQGAKGESVGGLFCNSDGKLELSRPKETRLCIPGVGGVKVVNKLGTNAAVCRTDYPGDESETVPMNTQPGQEYELCAPDQMTYYKWQGSTTSAQYYVNNAGVPLNRACDWGHAGADEGNWAPINIGASRGSDGNTYLSILPNAPTNPDAKLNFNIIIKGDISGDCAFKDGNYWSKGAISPTGCTVSIAIKMVPNHANIIPGWRCCWQTSIFRILLRDNKFLITSSSEHSSSRTPR